VFVTKSLFSLQYCNVLVFWPNCKLKRTLTVVDTVSPVKACTHISVKLVVDTISIENFPSFEIVTAGNSDKRVMFSRLCKHHIRDEKSVFPSVTRRLSVISLLCVNMTLYTLNMHKIELGKSGATVASPSSSPSPSPSQLPSPSPSPSPLPLPSPSPSPSRSLSALP
jgi:hypothetical protein